MNKLSKAQREEVEHFRSITSTNEKTAIEYLKAENWVLQNSIDSYYTNPPVRPPMKTDRRAIERLWTKYRDPGEDIMKAEGVGQFVEDLKVDPADVAVLVLCYHMNANIMSEFSKEEFTGGIAKLGCDSIEKLRRRLPELRVELDDDETFRRVYEFSYGFARKRDTKIVEQPMAVAMWGLLFQGNRSWCLLEDWIEFLHKVHNRPVLKDTWQMLLDFAWTTKPDFSNYDPVADAWPPLIDEFVDHMCAARGQPSPAECIRDEDK